MTFPDLFKHISHIVYKLMMLKWGTVSKHTTIPTFFQRSFDTLGLIFPSADMQSIIDANENWLAQCATQVSALHAKGGLGVAMFETKLKDLVSGEVEKTMKNSLADLLKDAIAKKVERDVDTLRAWREALMDKLEKEVANLSILPSKRVAPVPYRSAEIVAVSISCLTDQCDMYIVAAFKGAAIFRGFLPALDAETAMGFTANATDQQLLVKKEMFTKA